MKKVLISQKEYANTKIVGWFWVIQKSHNLYLLKEGRNKMKNTNESGRSMVEMLGVLAIIGVLSIGGIAGYSLAMNRYRANEILNVASMVSIAAVSKNGGAGGAASLNDVDSPAVPALTSISADANGVVTIKVDGDYEKVAKLVRQLSGARTDQTANGTTIVVDMRNSVKNN